METQLQMFQVVTHGHHRCDIMRLPGLQGSYDKSEHFYTQAFLRLESIPLFWHGNGPSKSLYMELSTHVNTCIKNKPRVIASLTTFPKRMSKVEEVLDSLYKQSWKLDAIHLNIPEKVVRFSSLSWDEGALGKEISRLKAKYGESLLKVNRPKDYGPSTKLLGTLLVEKDPTTLIVVVDDDTVYHSDTVKSYVNEYFNHRGSPITTYCEELKGGNLDSWDAISGNRTCLGWACAWKGVLFEVSMFDDSIFDYTSVPQGCVVHDDVYISGYLYRKGIRPFNIDPGFNTVVSHTIIDSKVTVGGTEGVRTLQQECISYFSNFTNAEMLAESGKSMKMMLPGVSTIPALKKSFREGGILHSVKREYDCSINDAANTDSLGPLSWFQRFWEPCMACEDEERIGSIGDGGKWICNPTQQLNEDSLIISIGSNNDFSFEFDIMRRFGSKIHVYDFTSNPPANCDEKCAKHIFFHKYGLGNTDAPPLLSLQSLHAMALETTKFTHKFIDLLKIDCEGCETVSLVNPAVIEYMSKHVIQIAIEVHIGVPLGKDVTTAKGVFRFWKALLDAGFYTFHKEPNIEYSNYNQNQFCVEYALLNRRFVSKDDPKVKRHRG